MFKKLFLASFLLISMIGVYYPSKEENTKNILNKVSSKNKNILENKSSNSIMALGAMEVHLNMAMQALKVFINDKKE